MSSKSKANKTQSKPRRRERGTQAKEPRSLPSAKHPEQQAGGPDHHGGDPEEDRNP